MQKTEARQEPKQPQPSCHQARWGGLKQTPTWGGRIIPSWPPWPSQMPLWNRYEALQLQGEAHYSRDEGLSGDCPEQVSHWAHPNYR